MATGLEPMQTDGEPYGPARHPAQQREASGDAEPMQQHVATSGEAEPMQQERSRGKWEDYELDCYPYTFSPLLLFAQERYFDKGHSNYNSVARFFAPALGNVDMLENVLYDRKNMLYEELLNFVLDNRMFVPCCIEAHFTAIQVVGDRTLVYYDPLRPGLNVVTGESCLKLLGFLLLKCNLGDSQHMQDNKAYYTGPDSNPMRRILYALWKTIHQLDVGSQKQGHEIPMDLDQYLLINNRRDPRTMSCQLTGNTCYFQTYLFGVLCKAGGMELARDGASIRFRAVGKLSECTVSISRFLLEFFVQQDGMVMRPLTNCNLVIDFFHYTDSPYYRLIANYLQLRHISVPDYELQFRRTLDYFERQRTLHRYGRFTLCGAMPSTLNSKSLQPVFGTDDGAYKLAGPNYYKYRACNLMFGFNTGIMSSIKSFCEFNALRKNQLLAFYQELMDAGAGVGLAAASTNKFRDYYFMPQFEVGQKELVDVHHYTYLLDMCSLLSGGSGQADKAMVERVNEKLADHIYWSTQKRSDYDKILSKEDFKASKKSYTFFKDHFMSIPFLFEYMALGFQEINPKEKDINSLTQTVFYSADLMRGQAYRMEHEFEKECINQMARSTQRAYLNRFDGGQSASQKYTVSIKIGHGFTYSKYNTLMHFLSVMESYWHNPDLNNIQMFGKDIRALLAVSCQKIFFEEGRAGGFYHYGVIETTSHRSEMDLAVATSVGYMNAGVSRQKTGNNRLVLTDRVYEYHYLRDILSRMLKRAQGVRVKSDNPVLNLCLLSLMLDFGLYEEHCGLVNLPLMKRLIRVSDKRQLQVEVANMIHEFDRKNTADSVTRIKLEGLIFEASYKFLVNKNFPVQSWQNELIQQLNSDSAYQQHLLMCKVNMSLCQINKSVEVDYYKLRCNGPAPAAAVPAAKPAAPTVTAMPTPGNPDFKLFDIDGDGFISKEEFKFRTIIPHNFSKSTGDYLEEVSKRYTFLERDGRILYDELAVFDLSSAQPEINLFTVRFDSATDVQSMVKYVEIRNVFKAIDSDQHYLLFIADNALLLEVESGGSVTIRISKIAVEVATIFFNQAISFLTCFKYADSEDVILFASRNIKYMVDSGGQFDSNYYGMKHELIQCITSEELFLDLDDQHVFKEFKLSELITESKTVVYFPDFLLQVPSRQELINLLDLAIHVRNVSFFILVLFYLSRCSVSLQYVAKEHEGREEIKKITGPWLQAIKYVLNEAPDDHYEAVFEKQFFDLNQHEQLPLADFIEVLCENFTKYQRHTDDGQYQIVPTQKQKAFLQRIVCAEECFHFSEVGSGKTKVILPLLCQMFLSNNAQAHRHFARGGKSKNVLVVLVPEHLVADARTQVYRYCLNLNFREEYRVYDDIFALLHESVSLGARPGSKYSYDRSSRAVPPMKQIFVTSFNQFKRALTHEKICRKVWGHREHMLVVADEVDDFLDRDKLVFNICSNKGNSFDKPTLELYFEVSRAVYDSEPCPDGLLDAVMNGEYWRRLHEKFAAIHAEIQDASRSVNKAFGIFNEQTLRHCCTNIAHDVEGYKSLIARPYESVNRAMPGSYYSDVERTIYLTFVILTEDIGKYDELFQQERKFISFEYWSQHITHLDYDDLVYGQDLLSELVVKFPEIKQGLIRFLYEIILRRMEIRDKSRSVNSIDVVFNFDCIGFTGTPFIDNYPTFSYLSSQREDDIPDMIDRSFYAYTCDRLSQAEFEQRFARFQGHNSNVLVEYVSSNSFVQMSAVNDELAILKSVFVREEGVMRGGGGGGGGGGADCGFNVIVDLCGIFKRSSIHNVRDLVLRHFGQDRFHYVYHIDQADNTDRILSVNSDNDVQFDEEFYKFLCKTYGAALREKVFFFVDNRNVIGKDVPFQLVFQRRFGLPLFTKSVVLAHDVDDFSKIWQAMGRSRTMNDTRFTIYLKGIPDGLVPGVQDIKTHELTRMLYVRNCDQKVAGNLSSIYHTLVSLLNLAQESFYYCDEIVNTFLEKMTGSITANVRRHEDHLASKILRAAVPSRVLWHILTDKFKRSSVPVVAQAPLTGDVLEELLRQIVQQKYEQRVLSHDIYDEYLRLLSGEQVSLMEISYTKQQQKQKQKQQNKNQDRDTMDIFDRKNQLEVSIDTDNYYQYALTPQTDHPKIALGLPLPIPILSLTYLRDGIQRAVHVYPTLQFLYSHHIQADYITQEVRSAICNNNQDPVDFCRRFLAVAAQNQQSPAQQRPETDPFMVGQTVVIHGLTSGMQYNGQRGQIVRPGEDGRWGVLLDEDLASNALSFKAENLRKVEKGAASGCGRDGGRVKGAMAGGTGVDYAVEHLQIKTWIHHIRQNPQYTLAALQEGIYVIGMKDQFNVHDVQAHPLRNSIQYIADEMGFVLYQRADTSAAKSVDSFGPYFVEQYVLMEVLSKHEVAQNVLDYYVNHKHKLEESVRSYTEAQGKGFICWRFLMNEAVKAEAALFRSGSREKDLDTAAAPMETDRVAPRNPADMEDLD